MNNNIFPTWIKVRAGNNMITFRESPTSAHLHSGRIDMPQQSILLTKTTGRKYSPRSL